MDLQQEYYNRHQLAPLIRFADKNVILLRQNDEKDIHRLVLVNLNFAGKAENNPGSFKFIQQSLVYDGGSMSGHIWKTFWDKRLEFDDWETWIQEWAALNKGVMLPVSGDEIELVLWEIFIYSHDSFLAVQLPNFVQDKLSMVIDCRLSLEERLTAANDVEEFIKNKNKNTVAQLLNLRTMLANSGTYANWLVQLLK